MIKPVTFQGISNFKANLYALEVKSRFIDQANANGYYKNYGSELAAVVIGETIQVGTGAFVVQGRMSEITIAEIVTPSIVNGNVGYVCLRCETYHPSDEYNTRLVVYTAATLNEIELTQEDTYQNGADETNKIYELPIYSFAISNGAITNLTKLIEPCGDYEKLKAIADDAKAKAQSALDTSKTANTTSQAANTTAGEAKSIAETANSTSNDAKGIAQGAADTANDAKNTAERAEQTVTTQHQQMTAEIEALAQQIGEKQGTTITINETPQASLPFKGETTDDKIVLFMDGGEA